MKAAGIATAFPWFDSLGGFAHAAEMETPPQRLLLICLPLGIYRDAVIPKQTGANYPMPEYVRFLEAYRDRLTVISGLDHPEVGGGHSAEPRIFTGVPSHQPNALSLDQAVASRVGEQTRFDSLVLSAGRNEFSWTASGTMIPSESSMSRVYAKLFGGEDASSTKEVLRQIGHRNRTMDLVRRQAEALSPRLSAADQEKLGEYLRTVRETERRLAKSERWVHTPKPQVDVPMPEDPAEKSEIVSQLRNVCDIAHLAFQTDSTRVITFGYFQQNGVDIPGVKNAYHALSHHGKDPGNIAQLKLIESAFFKELGRLLDQLQATREGNGTLLDRTTIVVTSNLGNGSNHSNKDLPVLLIGGRYNHGQHLAFDPSTVPLSNLYVSVLNQFGFADRSFATATGPLPGLEIG